MNADNSNQHPILDQLNATTINDRTVTLQCSGAQLPDVVHFAHQFGEITEIRNTISNITHTITITYALRDSARELNNSIQIHLRMAKQHRREVICMKHRRDEETDEQSRRIKINSGSVSVDGVYRAFRRYGPIEHIIRANDTETTICFATKAAKGSALKAEEKSHWEAQPTTRSGHNEYHGTWGPCTSCNMEINMGESQKESHDKICKANQRRQNVPKTQTINEIPRLQPQTPTTLSTGRVPTLSLTERLQKARDYIDQDDDTESIISEFCAVPREYRQQGGNMGPFSSHI